MYWFRSVVTGGTETIYGVFQNERGVGPEAVLKIHQRPADDLERVKTGNEGVMVTIPLREIGDMIVALNGDLHRALPVPHGTVGLACAVSD